MKARTLVSIDEFNEYVPVEKELIEITKSTARAVGDEFFLTLARSIQRALGVGFVLIGRVIYHDDDECVQTIALLRNQEQLPNITYSLRGTPCRNVVNQKICYHPSNIQQDYPEDLVLVELGIESYLGYPMIDIDGKTLGVIAVLDTHEISEERRAYILSMLWVIASRGAAEIHHKIREANLENVIRLRTEDLVSAQMKLVEQDKMASLGRMVAGFAHEINTPIGVALTASSGLGNIAQSVKTHLNGEKVSRSELISIAGRMMDASLLVESNLSRAGELISSFKRVSVDLSEERKTNVVLIDYVDALIKAHTPALTEAKVTVEHDIDPSLIIVMPSGALGQIFSNLISNTIMHAYPNGETGTIRISARRNDEIAIITYQDDGVGVTPEIAQYIFEPFFTTKRARGGTGLGSYIIYNIITKLGGRIATDTSVARGFKIDMELPIDS